MRLSKPFSTCFDAVRHTTGKKGISSSKLGRSEDEGVTHMGLRGLLSKGSPYEEAFHV